jgi:hypothetical protein
MSTPDDQIRLNILELLYKRFRDNETSPGVDRAIIQAILGLSEKEMDVNILFLAEKALVALTMTTGSKWTFAKITPDGMEVAENKELYAEKLSATQDATGQNLENPQENFVRTMDPQLNFAEQLSDGFNQAYNQIRDANISNSEKGKIEKQLIILEKELHKAQNADLGKIQKQWEWLKKNAGWLNPTLGQVVLEEIKTVLEIT